MENGGSDGPAPPQQPYVNMASSLDLEGAEAFALQVQADLNEEADALIQTDRSCVPYIYGFYLTILLLLTAFLTGLLFTYRDDWDRACDYDSKIWSLVCLGRALIQMVHNLAVTTLRLQHREVPKLLIASSRMFHIFGFSWWIYGIKVVMVEQPCTERTIAFTVSRVLFWITASIFALPLLIYMLLCLFLPCIIYFIVRFAVRPADRQPTPQEIIQQLEVKSYKDLLEILRRQYNVENDSVVEPREGGLLPSLSLENVLEGVSSLLASHTQQQQQQQRQASSSPTMTTPWREREPSISINKACPICMVDLADDDQLLVMPCDKRHFFHKSCVEHWLETSQACPICRANIVHLITGTPTDASTGVAPRNSLELQI